MTLTFQSHKFFIDYEGTSWPVVFIFLSFMMYIYKQLIRLLEI